MVSSNQTPQSENDFIPYENWLDLPVPLCVTLIAMHWNSSGSWWKMIRVVSVWFNHNCSSNSAVSDLNLGSEKPGNNDVELVSGDESTSPRQRDIFLSEPFSKAAYSIKVPAASGFSKQLGQKLEKEILKCFRVLRKWLGSVFMCTIHVGKSKSGLQLISDLG